MLHRAAASLSLAGAFVRRDTETHVGALRVCVRGSVSLNPRAEPTDIPQFIRHPVSLFRPPGPWQCYAEGDGFSGFDRFGLAVTCPVIAAL